MKKTTTSPWKTKQFAQEYARKLKGGEILALVGELGSGKTTFVQGLAQGLGIKKRVLSPTFILMRSYEGKMTLFHIDLYRINTIEEVEILGLEEIWSQENTVVVIEWAEKVKTILPKNTTWIYFEYKDENKRCLTIKP